MSFPSLTSAGDAGGFGVWVSADRCLLCMYGDANNRRVIPSSVELALMAVRGREMPGKLQALKKQMIDTCCRSRSRSGIGGNRAVGRSFFVVLVVGRRRGLVAVATCWMPGRLGGSVKSPACERRCCPTSSRGMISRARIVLSVTLAAQQPLPFETEAPFELGTG
ncbi:uncharacterized protein LY79DRAFT_547515 [Colletotrichum navitas]|uniref:Uncharacterized protein n=1 Tax=Colletotrichum navitas TaxID=681940 RepID=A0AAD8V8E6_9PEZI|nr:uncharacterized protein LY79DRAFT_547515 [Colletotrichum navitas]KAK1595370.1 hypothetical protein LY79DRAFT_547515 [Colletotrichum navitas]